MLKFNGAVQRKGCGRDAHLASLRSFAGCFKIRVRAGSQRHWHDLSHIRALLASAAINGSIRLEGALDTAVVIHDKIRILPVSAEFHPRPVIIPRAENEQRAVMHIEPDLLSVRVEIETSPHAPTQCHPENFVAGRAEVTDPAHS